MNVEGECCHDLYLNKISAFERNLNFTKWLCPDTPLVPILTTLSYLLLLNSASTNQHNPAMHFALIGNVSSINMEEAPNAFVVLSPYFL